MTLTGSLAGRKRRNQKTRGGKITSVFHKGIQKALLGPGTSCTSNFCPNIVFGVGGNTQWDVSGRGIRSYLRGGFNRQISSACASSVRPQLPAESHCSHCRGARKEDGANSQAVQSVTCYIGVNSNSWGSSAWKATTTLFLLPPSEGWNRKLEHNFLDYLAKTKLRSIKGI